MIVYWIALSPTDVPKSAFSYINHIIPGFLIFADFIINRVPFKISHVWFIVLIMYFYGAWNTMVSLYEEKPIYPIMDPTVWTTWIGFALGPWILVVFHVFYIWISNKRLSKIAIYEQEEIYDNMDNEMKNG